MYSSWGICYNFGCLFDLYFGFSEVDKMSVSAQSASENRLTHPPTVIADQTSRELNNGRYDTLLPAEGAQILDIYEVRLYSQLLPKYFLLLEVPPSE